MSDGSAGPPREGPPISQAELTPNRPSQSDANLTVDEALIRKKGVEKTRDELLEGVDPDSADAGDVRAMAAEDPGHAQGVRAERDLAALRDRLATFIEVKSQGDQGGTVTTPDSETKPDNVEALLVEVEDDGSLAEKIAHQKLDIENAHSLISGYNTERRKYSGKITRKQHGDLDRFRNREFRNRWQVADLANEPDRLSSVIDSILCAEGVSDQIKNTIVGYITDQVAEYVGKTAGTVDPDIIAKRLTASLQPGFASEQLQQVLLKKYFAAAEGRQTEDVVDNFERFVRGILRVADQPAIASTALDIGEFKTALLPEGGLYQFRIKKLAASRVDRPDILARNLGIGKTLKLLRIHATGLASAKKQEGVPSIPAPTGRFESLAAAEGGQMIQALGQAEYDRRVALMDRFSSHYANQSLDETVMSDQSGQPFWILGLDYASGYREYREAEIYWEAHPDAREFLKSMMDSESQLIDELPHFFSTPTIMRPATAEETGGKFILSDRTVNWPTGDGYMLEAHSVEGEPDPSSEYWQTILDTHRGQIEQAKSKILSTRGINRRHSAFASPTSKEWYVVRPETAEDRKPYHPIDALLESDSTLPTEQDSNATIEGARTMIAEERNRFFNERGIAVIYDSTQDASSRAIELRKHPRNPKALIVTVRDTAADGTIKQARVLMDPDLRFQLGSKKVHSSQALLALNAVTADIAATYRCQVPLKTEEGVLGEGKSDVEARIAHLRILGEEENYGQKQWLDCVDVEGDDLDVLNVLERVKRVREGHPEAATRNFTYVNAVKKDDPSLGPLRIFLE